MNIYVGNLSREVTEEELREAFKAFGQVTSVSIVKDKYSGQPRGFGFVDMPAKAEAQAAIIGLNGKELKGRPLTVSEARPRREDQRVVEMIAAVDDVLSNQRPGITACKSVTTFVADR